MSWEDLSDDGCETLVKAIVKQAVNDYKNALSMKQKNPDSLAADAHIKQLRKFFLSGYFSTITQGASGEEIMQKAKEEFEAKRKTRKISKHM